MNPRRSDFRPRALFICGSLNQTTQLQQVARELPGWDTRFTPYVTDAAGTIARRLGLIEWTIGGDKRRGWCLEHLRAHRLPIDLDGRDGRYDLVVTCSDLVLPERIRGNRLVVVQEGMTDPAGPLLRVVQRYPAVPRWVAGTAATGLSRAYDRFCVASDGYRALFARRGAPIERMTVTGIPNFDDCERYRRGEFALRGYALVCTSDLRENLRPDDREAFLRRAMSLAGDRRVVVKLHPNEHPGRATAEVRHIIPGAQVFTTGSAEEMVAHCDVLICQWSTLAFVGLALGKTVHSSYSAEELRSLLPVQNGCAARNIAAVCREVVGVEPPPVTTVDAWGLS